MSFLYRQEWDDLTPRLTAFASSTYSRLGPKKELRTGRGRSLNRCRSWNNIAFFEEIMRGDNKSIFAIKRFMS